MNILYLVNVNAVWRHSLVNTWINLFIVYLKITLVRVQALIFNVHKNKITRYRSDLAKDVTVEEYLITKEKKTTYKQEYRWSVRHSTQTTLRYNLLKKKDWPRYFHCTQKIHKKTAQFSSSKIRYVPYLAQEFTATWIYNPWRGYRRSTRREREWRLASGPAYDFTRRICKATPKCFDAALPDISVTQ